MPRAAMFNKLFLSQVVRLARTCVPASGYFTIKVATTMSALYIGRIAAVFFIILFGAPSWCAGTPEQDRACRSDAWKFCRDFVPDVAQITACMNRNISKLSPACRSQFNKPGGQAGARKS